MTTRSLPLERILARISALTRARRKGGKVAAASSVVAIFYLTVVFRQGRRPEVTCRRNGHNVRVLRALAEVVDRPYYPSWLTPNAHVNNLLGFLKKGPRVPKTRELVRTWGTYGSTEDRQTRSPTCSIIRLILVCVTDDCTSCSSCLVVSSLFACCIVLVLCAGGAFRLFVLLLLLLPLKRCCCVSERGTSGLISSRKKFSGSSKVHPRLGGGGVIP